MYCDRNPIFRKLAYLGLVGGIIGLIAMLGWWLVMGYEISRDIGAWKERAQVATLADDIVIYTASLRAGMDKWGYDSGYCAFIFKKPDNDLALAYRAVYQAEEQARIVATLPKDSDAYQQGVDNLRGTLRELAVGTEYCWATKNALPVLGGWLLVCFCWLWPTAYFINYELA